ncbi:MAG: family transcriptional regulator [Solirubrobacterales bacterium]|nr:family transcriptional regulator [Solirubrobacterales bacterium]
MANPSHLALGQTIREFRKKKGISQEALGLEAGLDRTYISSVERGRRNISFDNLVKIAEAVDAKPSQLLEGWEQISDWKASKT